MRIASWAPAGIEWATMPTTRSRVGVGPVANVQRVADVDADLVGQRPRNDDRAAGVERGQGCRPVTAARNEDQPTVGQVVAAHDGGRFLATP